MSLIRRYIPCAIALALMLNTIGCGPWRDDTTGATRQIIADHLSVDYDKVTPSRTLYDLSCDEHDVAEIVASLEDAFDITISDAEVRGLSSGKWVYEIAILDLANLARSKRFP